MADESQETRGLKEVLAGEILAKIEKGEPVKYDHIRIIGDLDIVSLNLPLNNGKFLIDPIIEIVSSIFEGTVNFSLSKFQNYINLSKTKFTGSAIFCESIFSGGVNFIGSHFGVSAHFYGSYFGGHVGFMGAQFSGLATFYDSTFKEDAHFLKSRFEEDATFRESEFLKVADFSSSKFSEKAIFEGTKFKGDAKFIVTRFGGFTNFRSCSFGKSLNLEGSNIYTIFLQDAIFEKDSTVLLKHAEFSRLELPWKLIRNKLEHDGSTYLALFKNYNNLEWFDDADECNYQYRTIRRKKQLHGIKMDYGSYTLVVLWVWRSFLFSFNMDAWRPHCFRYHLCFRWPGTVSRRNWSKHYSTHYYYTGRQPDWTLLDCEHYRTNRRMAIHVHIPRGFG